jgi:serine/threonine-protein kinase
MTSTPHHIPPPGSTTQFFENSITRTRGGRSATCSVALREEYNLVLRQKKAHWEEDLHFIRPLGSGGQGVVFLSERRGSDGFILPMAIKVFSPERFESDVRYAQEMEYLAQITAKVARIQQDHLLAVQNWRSVNNIRMMEMEWVDGFDLSQLLRQEVLDKVKKRVSAKRWKHLEEVVISKGPTHPKVKPGIAVPIIRDCLGALAALHREGIVHGDIKPSNIMLKRTGNAKVVDIGSAFEIENRPPMRPFTLSYAAPEVLEGKEITPRSDIASLGYVLIEMLSGQKLFSGHSNFNGLDGRLFLASRLQHILPPAVASSELLMKFCKSLVAPDPNKRFENAEAADLFKNGAADFHRELVKGDLACEYEPEIRNLLDDFDEEPAE